MTNERNPNGWLTFVTCLAAAIFLNIASSYASTFFYSVGGLIALFGGLMLLWNFADIIVRMYERTNAIAKTTTRVIELEKASRLSDSQANAVPAITYLAMVGLIHEHHESEWQYVVITKSGVVPYDWVQQFLRECDFQKLRAVRSYSNGYSGTALRDVDNRMDA